MSWKKILLLCLSLVFIFGFYAETKAQSGEGVKYVSVVNRDAFGNPALYQNSRNLEGGIYTKEGDSYKKVDTKFVYTKPNPNGGKGTSENLYVTQNSKGENVFYRTNGNGNYDRWVHGSEYDTVKRDYELYNKRQLSLKKAEESNNARAQEAAAGIRASDTAAQAEADAAGGKQEFDIGACRPNWNSFPDFTCLVAWLLNQVALPMVSLFSGLSGLIFDKIMTFSIIEMGTNIKINEGGLADAWKIMRDVVNIAFIFVLLYIGIMTIVKGFESGTNKMIATVIVVALVINFSLFFTKIIIDGSNIIAVNFYQSIKAQTSASNDTEWQGVAGTFFNYLKIGTINKAVDAEIKGNQYLNIIKLSLGGIVILIVLGIVLFIASLMFISRYIILIFILVTSAAAVGSWILPSLKKSVWDKWWAALIGQAFFAPVFLLFLWLSLQMTAEISKSQLASGGGWSELFILTNPSGSINMVMSYLIIVGFLIGSIIISKSMADKAGSGAGKITGFLGGTALGAAAWGGRNTIGRFGSRVANSGAVSSMANSRHGALRLLGGGLIRGGDKLAGGSMDIRGVGALSGATDGMGAAGGVGGFGAQIDRQTTRRQQILDRTSQLNAPQQNERAANNRQLSDRQRVAAAVNEDLGIVNYTRDIENRDRDLVNARAELQRATQVADAGAIATANAEILRLQGLNTADRAARNTARTAIVGGANLVDRAGAPILTFDNLEADIRNITAANAQQTRGVTARREQALTDFENSFVSAITTGLNRTRISNRLRNQGNNNIGGNAGGNNRT